MPCIVVHPHRVHHHALPEHHDKHEHHSNSHAQHIHPHSHRHHEGLIAVVSGSVREVFVLVWC